MGPNDTNDNDDMALPIQRMSLVLKPDSSRKVAPERPRTADKSRSEVVPNRFHDQRGIV